MAGTGKLELEAGVPLVTRPVCAPVPRQRRYVLQRQPRAVAKGAVRARHAVEGAAGVRHGAMVVPLLAHEVCGVAGPAEAIRGAVGPNMQTVAALSQGLSE